MGLLGLYNTTDDLGYNHLCYNAFSVYKGGRSFMNSYGVRTDDNSLLLDNSLIAKSIFPFDVHDDSSQIHFGTTELLEHNNIVDTNIDDYRVLLTGVAADGTKVFDPNVSYNVIYPELQDNIETSATFTKEECPVLMIKYHVSRIKSGDTLDIPYYVDTYHMNRTRYDELTDSFTIVVLDKDNKVIAKKNQYAGDGVITIGPFTTLGRGWFEIKAIDNDGCASPSVFCDYFVESTQPERILNVDIPLLQQYHITEGIDAYDPTDTVDAYGHPIVDIQEKIERAAFRNKLGFTALFQYAKNLGYDGVKLPKITEDGVQRDAYFNISYNKNIYVNTKTINDAATSSNIMGKLDLDTIKFFKVKVSHTEGTDDYIYTDVVQIPFDTFLSECKQYLWTNWNESKYVICDGSARLYNNCYSVSSLSGISSQLTNANRLKRPQKTNDWPAVGDIHTPHKVGSRYEYFNPDDIATNGWYYLALVRDCSNRTSGKNWSNDSNLTLPDNFILDLNGATFHGLDVTNHVTNSRVVGLYNKVNVKVRNGKIQGRYKDMKDYIHIYCTIRFSVPVVPYTSSGSLWKLDGDISPGCATIETYGCSDCSFHNLEISQSVGYDSTMSCSGSAKYGVHIVGYNESAIQSALNELQNEFSKSSLSPTLYEDFPYESFYGENSRTLSITKTRTLTDNNGNPALRTGVIRTLDYDSSGYGTKYDRPNYGTRDHFFVLCYTSSGKLVRMFKIFRECHATLPDNVMKLKYIVYGKSGLFNDSIYPDGPNFPTGPTYEALRPGNNIVFSHCYVHDTKTNACHTEYAKGCGFIDAVFKRTGLGHDELFWGSSTSRFTNFEEGGTSIERAFFVYCFHSGKVMDENGVDGSNSIGFHGANQFYMRGCTGISIEDMQRVRCAIIEDCHLDKHQIGINKDAATAFRIIRNTVIDLPMQDVNRKNTNYGGQAFNGGWYSDHREPADKIVPMSDVTLNAAFRYNNFHFHRVRNGKQIFD